MDIQQIMDGIQVTAIGMGIVFAALYVLQLIMYGFKGLFYKEPKVEAAPVVVEAAVDTVVEEGLPKAVVAAISVAVACYLGGRPANIVSISRTHEAKTPWQQTARGAAMMSRRSN